MDIFPTEIVQLILNHTDLTSVHRAMVVNRSWNQAITRGFTKQLYQQLEAQEFAMLPRDIQNYITYQSIFQALFYQAKDPLVWKMIFQATKDFSPEDKQKLLNLDDHIRYGSWSLDHKDGVAQISVGRTGWYPHGPIFHVNHPGSFDDWQEFDDYHGHGPNWDSLILQLILSDYCEGTELVTSDGVFTISASD